MDKLERQYRRVRDYGSDEEQIANAPDTFADLTPASQAPAAATRDKWAALLQGADIPLIGERVEPDELED